MVAAIEHADDVCENADNTGWRCIAEYEGFSENTPALARKFIFGAYLDEPLALIDVDTSETIYYYHQNRLYNVAAMTNSSGNVVERYTFSAYGLPLIITGPGTDGTWGTADDVTASASAIGNPYLYTGQRWDPETENHYYKNRYQRPTLGRFISRDQLEYVDGMNLYEYVGSRPLFELDPTGLWWGGDIWRAIKKRYNPRGSVLIRNIQDKKLKKAVVQAKNAAKETIDKIEYNPRNSVVIRNILDDKMRKNLEAADIDLVGDSLRLWIKTAAGQAMKKWLECCERGEGKYLGENVSLGGFIAFPGLGALLGEGGGQVVGFCDTGEICLFAYIGGGGGVGGGMAGGLNVGGLYGDQAYKPDNYRRHFINPTVQVAGGPVGGYGGGSFGYDPDKGTYPETVRDQPRNGEGGISVGPGAGVVVGEQYQYYGKLGCIKLVDR